MGRPNWERSEFRQDERAGDLHQPTQRTASVEVLRLRRRALLVDGGRQIVGIGGVREAVAVDMPEGHNELDRHGDQCDPGDLALPSERHGGLPQQCNSITLH